MPDLYQSLKDRDLGHLRIVAQLWGIELATSENEAACNQLQAGLQDVELFNEVVAALPHDAREALESLAAEKGRMPWVSFIRRYGEVREMGPGRRDREEPHLKPVSPAEVLFYRGLIGRAFFDTPDGPREFTYIPDDLLSLIVPSRNNIFSSLGMSENSREKPLGRTATPKEHLHPIPANDQILDDATTLLSALRMGMEIPQLSIPPRILLDLLTSAGLINASRPQLDPVRSFLEMPRQEAMKILISAWAGAEDFNELQKVPGFICEGEWKNAPLDTRHRLLGFLNTVPVDKWWSISSFIDDIKQMHPDFQRPAGDYDSWFIRVAADGEYLRGFENWDAVDGALIRFFLVDILHRLGLVDVASVEEGGEATAFRVLSESKRQTTIESGKLTAASNGLITISRLVPRAVRYQIARFCEWLGSVKGEYRYRVTTTSLMRARRQHLRPEHLLNMLRRYSSSPLPPSFVRALKRWELNGTEARIENPIILKVSKPEVLDELRRSRAGRFLGEILGPTVVVIKKGATSQVLSALAEKGLLAEVTLAEEIK